MERRSNSEFCAEIRAAHAASVAAAAKPNSPTTYSKLCADERDYQQRIRSGELADPTIYGGSAGQYPFGRGGTGDPYILRMEPSDRVINKK